MTIASCTVTFLIVMLYMGKGGVPMIFSFTLFPMTIDRISNECVGSIKVNFAYIISRRRSMVLVFINVHGKYA